MNLKNLKSISAEVATKRGQLAELNAQAARCQEAIATAGRHTDSIASLRQQRAEAKGRGFLSRLKVNTSELDRQIAQAEQANAEALQDGEDAKTALVLVQQQISTAEGQLGDLLQHQKREATALARGEFEAAETAYSEALEAMRKAVHGIVAAAAVVDTVSGTSNQSSVAWLYVSSNEQHLSSGRHGGFHVPMWLNIKNSIGKPETNDLMVKLEAAGYDFGRGAPAAAADKAA